MPSDSREPEGHTIHNFKINNYKPPPYDLAVKREGYKLKMKLYGGNTFRIFIYLFTSHIRPRGHRE